MSNWFKISAAAKLSGKPSAATIRREVKRIVKQDGHADRQHVRPSAEVLKKCKEDGTQPVYEISEEFLDRLWPQGAASDADDSDATSSSQAVSVLAEQIDRKDARIRELEGELRKSQSVLQVVLLMGKRRAQKVITAQFPDVLPPLPAKKQRWFQFRGSR